MHVSRSRTWMLLLAIAAATVGCSGAASSGDPQSASGSSSGGSQGSSGASSSSSSGGSTSSSGGSTGSSTSSGSGGSSSSGSGGSSSSGSGGSSSSSGSSSGSSGGPPPEAGAVWQPAATAPIHFHWMIGGFTTADILTGQDGQVVYDIDGEGASASDVAAIHAAGAIAVCYVDVGTLEMGRSDYSEFPASVIGPAVQGWPGENWLLVTAANQSIILPLMKARFQNWCLAKGFDAIEPDNLDGWTNISNITETDNVAYDLAVGKLANALPLSIGLKNVMTDLDASQYPSFLAEFQWALNEQCYEYSECDTYTAAGSFLPAGKAVFDVEYNVSPTCSNADSAHINAQLTDLDLVGATSSGYEYTPCIPDSQTTW
jgi:hypothetical protein